MNDNIEVRTVLVTPEMAQDILDNQLYERQRSMRDKHVKMLENSIIDGLFVQFTSISWAVKAGEMPKLIDGQHRLKAIAKSGIPANFVEVFYPCENDEDVAKVFAYLDQNKKRTSFDGANSFGAFDGVDIPKVHLRSFAASLNLIGTDSISAISPKKLPHEITALSAEYATEAEEYYKIIGGNVDKELGQKMRHAICFALFMVAYKGNPARCIEFFKAVASMEGGAKSPAMKCALFLLRGEQRNRDQRTIALRYVAKCYNLHYSGQSAGRVTTSKPFKLAGTNHTVK